MSFDSNAPSTLVGDSYPVPPPTPLRILDLPTERDVVKTLKGKTLRLVRKISEGGEGVVYETDLEGFVAKVVGLQDDLNFYSIFFELSHFLGEN